MLFLLQTFGGLALVLSGIIVVNMISAMNIGASITRTIEVIGETLRYDIEMTLKEPLPTDAVNTLLAKTPGIMTFEGWGEARGLIVHSDGTTGESFQVIAPQTNTDLFLPQMLEGNWLPAAKGNGIALPVSYYVGNIFGNIFFRTHLNFAIAPFSVIIWLGMIVVFSFIAGAIPGLKAIRLTVRDTLAYE